MNNKHIRMLVFDVDGTLVDDDQNLSQDTSSILIKLQQKGILVSFATGKILPSVAHLVEILQIKIPVILANGALLQYPNGNFVHQKYLSPALIRNLLYCCTQYDADLALFTPEHIFVLKENFNTDHIKCEFKEKITVISAWEEVEDYFEQICKAIYINRTNRDEIHRIRDYLSVEISCNGSISTGSPDSVEVMPANVSKRHGLEILCKHVGVSPAEVMAFGDQINDKGMIEYAGLGVAVGNAIEEIKSIADFVIGTNNDAGPAEFLRTFFRDMVIEKSL